MSKFMRNLLLLFLAIVLTACAGEYVPPVGENTATLKVHNASFFERLRVEELDGESNCAGVLNMHTGRGVARFAIYAVSVKSGSRFYFRLIGVNSRTADQLPLHRCTIASSFVPAAGRTYLARFDSEGEKCHLRFVEQAPASDGQERDLRVATLERAPACE